MTEPMRAWSARAHGERSPGNHRLSRLEAKRDARGFTLIELVVAMAVLMLVMGLVPVILETVTTATSAAEGTLTGAAQAKLAIQNLDSQVSSAVQVCYGTTDSGDSSDVYLTDPSSGTPLTVPQSWSLRIEQVTSSTTDQWEQWMVDPSSGLLQEEHYTPGDPGDGWVTVAKTIYNTTTAPFTLTTSAAGSPQEVQINLQVSEKPGRLTQRLDIQSAVSAFSYPYAASETCDTTSAEPTS